MAEDIDFKFPLRRACAAEIQKMCKGVSHGHARVIRCLQDHVDSDDMSSECRKEVQGDQRRGAQDYRLNYRLKKSCVRCGAAVGG